MYVEVSVAVNYLLSHLYTKLPRRRVDNFGEELQRGIMRKLQPNWFTDTSNQDASHRYFQTSGPQTDFIFAEAAISSGLDWIEIQACLPAGLVISIDPGHVACQYGSTEPSVVSSSAWGGNYLYSASLPSSGYSSASSISSNGSPGSWQKTKHQILYSASNRGGQSHQLVAEKDLDVPPSETRRIFDDVQTHLATETALSVLTEPEDFQPNNNGEFSHGLDHQTLHGSSESTSAVGDFNDQQDINCNLVSGSKTNGLSSTDATGDRKYLEHITNDIHVKSDLEHKFSINDLQQKGNGLTDLEEDSRLFEFQGGQLHQSEQSQLPFSQTVPNFVQKSLPTPSFTAATFAATKFGSTKLKSHSKRPHRLVSPCEGSVLAYSAQIIDSIVQPAVSSNQLVPNDRLLRPIDSHRSRCGSLYGGHHFIGSVLDSNRAANFFGNYHPHHRHHVPVVQPMDRPNDLSYSGNNVSQSAGLVETNTTTMGPYGNNSGDNLENSIFGIRSNNLVNNPAWSQFEKIRNEFQLKNSQYIEQQHQQQQQQEMASAVNCSIGYSFNDSFKSNVLNSVNRNAFQQDILASLGPKVQTDAKSVLGEDLIYNKNLLGFCSSEKYVTNNGSGFPWSQDVSKSPTDSTIGQATNLLNISDR